MVQSFSNDWQLFDQKGCRKYLTQQEVKIFLKTADKAAPHIKAFAFTLAYTGCRLSEALALKHENLDTHEGILVFRTLKRRKLSYRAVPIPGALVVLLNELSLASEFTNKFWSFHRVTAWRYIKTLLSSAGIEGVQASPKGFRHQFALSAAQAKVPPHLIQRWMGHSRLETTAIYQNAVGAEERAFAEEIWKANIK